MRRKKEEDVDDNEVGEEQETLKKPPTGARERQPISYTI
jgi:hypothetical protein